MVRAEAQEHRIYAKLHPILEAVYIYLAGTCYLPNTFVI
jgi:hypothetical protein